MKYDAISIRARIFLSNAIILLLCVLIATGIISIAAYTFMYAYRSDNLDSQLENNLGFFSIYQVQVYVNDLQEDIASGEPSEKINEPKIRRSLDKIADIGAGVAVFENEKLLYVTDGYTGDELLAQETKYRPGRGESSFHSDESGSMFSSYYALGGGKTLHIIFYSSAMDKIMWLDNDTIASNFREAVLGVIAPVLISALLLILFINMLLSYRVTGFLVRPLNSLSAATRKISKGDLDCEIDYRVPDEMIELCRDFDNMRLQLQESEKMQNRYEENRRELIAGISHDLGSPLTLIQGYVSGLIDGIADTPEKKEKYLKTIFDTACHMDSLVDELFLLSKLEMNSIAFSFERVNVQEYFESAAQKMRDEVESAGGTFEADISCPPGANLQIDKVQMNRVFSNIVRNAIKYAKIEQVFVKLALKIEGKYAIMRLEDNGPGVLPEERNKIFDSFYRTDKARSGCEKSGSGLGLAISKRIVLQHGGNIFAGNSSMGGLAIIISLPLE